MSSSRVCKGNTTKQDAREFQVRKVETWSMCGRRGERSDRKVTLPKTESGYSATTNHSTALASHAGLIKMSSNGWEARAHALSISGASPSNHRAGKVVSETKKGVKRNQRASPEIVPNRKRMSAFAAKRRRPEEGVTEYQKNVLSTGDAYCVQVGATFDPV